MRPFSFSMVARSSLKGMAGRGYATVAHRSEDQVNRQRLRLVCGSGAHGTVVTQERLILNHLDCSDTAAFRADDPRRYKDHLMVVCLQAKQMDLPAIFNASIESVIRTSGHLLVHPDHGFVLLMIRSNPRSNQPKRGWQSIEHIHLDGQVRLSLQVANSVKPCRSCPNNGHSKGIRCTSQPGHQ